ncbi:LPXTG cell wall anchor domain-containing protein [Paenibacillus sp. 28ISP30-2]|nr:LPXTG cell wall anchor domain-containing protein [Paenibacillus sp. 28ISP30-2]
MSGGSPSNLSSTASQANASKISTGELSLIFIAGLMIIGGVSFVIKKRKKV